MWLDQLRKMKDASSLSTREIAKVSGVAEPTLEKIFAGITSDPKLSTIRQLVYSLGYSLDDLYPAQKNAPEKTLRQDTSGYKLVNDFESASEGDQQSLLRFASLAAEANQPFVEEEYISDDELIGTALVELGDSQLTDQGVAEK